jgi:hypothetical protein
MPFTGILKALQPEEIFMEIIAKIVDQNSTPAEAADLIEIWGTDHIDFQEHMLLVVLLRIFCRRMFPQRNHCFEVRALRETAVGIPGQVRFGVVLLANQNIFTMEEIATLKKGCQQLVDKLQPKRGAAAQQLLDHITEAEVSPLLQEELIHDFEERHGGHRLSRPVEIEIPQQARMVISGQILQAADDPVHDLHFEFLGSVFKADFENQRVLVGSNPGGGADVPKTTKTWAGCTSAPQFEFCTHAGLARAPLLLKIRRVPGGDGRLREELEQAELVPQGNGAPLIPDH